ncbi:MAG: MarR family transcriptional regulator [Thermoplasmata archaeon]|nr:MarR family transcriptional regulator [Thermoplasmata archaeon]MCI4337763.1 MarR family transcriptional regulator [Thermoplasmata archaeon]MCI4341393.1 MarR family transcriptional regulator [Thermoplasmata archaeon]
MTALEGLMYSFQQEQRETFRSRGITPVQYFVLRWLSKDGEANMSQLAGLLGVRPQTVTPIVDSLESSGWVRRTRSTEDRRESRLELTPKGSRVIEAIRASFFETLGRALDEAPAPSLRTSTEVLQSATSALLRGSSRAARARPKPR